MSYEKSTEWSPHCLPPEWHEHLATWIGWNFDPRLDFADVDYATNKCFAEFVGKISKYEIANVLVRPGSDISALQDLVASSCNGRNFNLDRVRFHVVDFSEPFLRDSGPTWVRSGTSLVALNWKFTAWSGFPLGEGDEDLAVRIANIVGTSVAAPMRLDGVTPFVAEGGMFDTNGKGDLLVTEECLLSTVQERNPGCGREEYEEIFRRWLGVNNVIWLGGGAVGDDTHGHIDDIARFVDESTIVIAVEHNKGSPNFSASQDNLRRLERIAGSAFRVVEIPFPRDIYLRGRIVPASYSNFCFVNGGIILPVFNQPTDDAVVGIFEGLFPDRKIETVYSELFLYGGGALHCLSQQQPIS